MYAAYFSCLQEKAKAISPVEYFHRASLVFLCQFWSVIPIKRRQGKDREHDPASPTQIFSSFIPQLTAPLCNMKRYLTIFFVIFKIFYFIILNSVCMCMRENLFVHLNPEVVSDLLELKLQVVMSHLIQVFLTTDSSHKFHEMWLKLLAQMLAFSVCCSYVCVLRTWETEGLPEIWGQPWMCKF